MQEKYISLSSAAAAFPSEIYNVEAWLGPGILDSRCLLVKQSS
jgi:hypothetical protein